MTSFTTVALIINCKRCVLINSNFMFLCFGIAFKVCVEELTGRSLLDKESVPKSVGATAIAPIGRYAISVDWSDGHKSLYPYKQIAALADTTQ